MFDTHSAFCECKIVIDARTYFQWLVGCDLYGVSTSGVNNAIIE